MGYESVFLGLLSLVFVCGLVMYFNNREKPSVHLDQGFLAVAASLFAFGVKVFSLQGQPAGPEIGIGIMLLTLAAPFILLFLLFWVPLRLLSPRGEKK